MEMNAIHTVHSALNTIMLKNEIEYSCNNKVVKEFLATDLILKME